jgi:hypothetical protein
MRLKVAVAIVAWVGLSNLATAQEWTPVTQNQMGTMFFVSDDSVRIVNAYRRAWIMMDYKESETRARSVKMLWEVDCAEERKRTLTAAAYSGQRGAGDNVYSQDQPSDWEYPVTETAGYTVLQMICKAPVRSEK